MTRYRGHFLLLICCVAVEAIIYYGLFGLGATKDLVLWVETIWMFAAVLIVVSVGERIDRR